MQNESMEPALSELARQLDQGALITDESEREYFAQDYFNIGPKPEAVVQPGSVDELARVLHVASAQGLAVYPRGGGYSYTDGYLVTKPGIMIDMRSMNRVIEVNSEDMYVTVEAGCTWAQLDRALAQHGLRTPFWGPMSGRNATVGGAISQGAISFGSARYGASADSVIGLKVVTVDGRIIHTGSGAQPNHTAFFRNYGPDLTGLFCGDCGSLGIKAEITLKLIKRPSQIEGLTFGFTCYEDYFAASAAVARECLATESIGTLAQTVTDHANARGLLGGIKAMWQVIGASSSLASGVSRAIRAALAGRRFAQDFEILLHLVVEGFDRASVAGQASILRAAVGKKGIEIANTVPTLLRSDPFPAYDMVSLTGQRQLPPSTILPFSKVPQFHADLTHRIAARKADMERLGVSVAPVFATVSASSFLYEIVIAWDDRVEEFHRRHSRPELIAKVEGRPDAPEARKLADDLRSDLIEVAYEHGGVHLQIGKVYPYTRGRDDGAMRLLRSLKAELDPHRLCNPGALGL